MSLKSLILFAMLSCAAFLSPANGETFTVVDEDSEYKGWVFDKNEDGTYNLTYVPSDYAPVGGELVIPGSVEVDGTTIIVSGVMSNDTTGIVSNISEGVFSSNPNIKSITVNKGVKTIGSSAFAYCSYLETVKFESGSQVKLVGDFAFNGCRNLKSVNLPEGVERIGQSAFAQCDAISSLSLPSSLVEIGSCAFQSCKNLANVTLPSSLESIGSYAFGQCEKLKSITIPGSVSVIGQYAFQFCYALASVTIEDSETNTNRVIEQGAFNQTDISSIYIPGSISVIQNNAFEHCQKLTTVVIGDGVDEIQSNAFGGCGSLSNVKFEAKSNPPSLADGAFTDWRISNGNVEVTVPDDADYSIDLKGGSLSVVKKPDPSKPTSISGQTSLGEAPVSFFSLSGAKIAAPKRGTIVLAVYADGASRKMVIR